ncbi:polyprenyl synthetase family protein [bacterium]|nr:polyprenyl synthetase family protein [bacterium]
MPKKIRSSNAVLKEFLDKTRRRIEEGFSKWLPISDETPSKLRDSMRYSVFAGGKRIRPILCLTVGEGLGLKGDAILKASCALELLHTYSLIHDDLPALDNDDLRRGHPTNHKVYGEAIAILAGDSLLTMSFEWLAESSALGISSDLVIDALLCFSKAVGEEGMVGGQALDMNSEFQKIDFETLKHIHLLKTGALIRASIEIGAILAGADEETKKSLSKLGENAGLLFQITDDILDVEGDISTLGKRPGSDKRKGKATYPSILGMPKAKELAFEAHKNAIEDISRTTIEIPHLKNIVDLFYNRIF